MAKMTDSDKKKSEKEKKANVEKETNTESTNVTWDPKGDVGAGDVGRVAQTSSSSGSRTTNNSTYQDDLNRLTEAKKKTQIAQLKQARDKALANLDVQEQNIKPAYQNARNQASATSQSGARSFAEYLANRGLTNSGASAQGEINRLSSLQNTLGGIDTAEANAYRDIANQRTAIENDYVSGVANANNAIAQEYYNNLLNYNEQQRQIVNQLKQQALGQYANDYKAYMNTLDPNSMEYLYAAAARGNKIANNYNTAMNNALANIQAGNINYNNATAVGMTVPQAQQYYNNYIAQQQAQAQAEAEQQAWDRYVAQTELNNATALNNANIANKNASTSNYYSQINNRNNNQTQDVIAPSKSAHKNVIEANFALDDGYGNITGYDKNAILEYVKNENMNNRMKDDVAIEILYDYGLKAEADALIGG